MAMTESERTRLKVERRKDAGLVRLSAWVHPDDLEHIKALCIESKAKKLAENANNKIRLESSCNE